MLLPLTLATALLVVTPLPPTLATGQLSLASLGERGMSKEEWLLDSITKFLRSPGWALPVMQFIDDNCVVFDDDVRSHQSFAHQSTAPDARAHSYSRVPPLAQEENKLAYSDIYAAFREMVESLLEMHLEDMGVTPEQFAGTVGRLSHTKAGQETLQQILAVDDYLSFKKMMVGSRTRVRARARSRSHARRRTHMRTSHLSQRQP